MIEPGSVVINEVLPFGEDLDWVELHNTTIAPIDIGGWYLSDRADELQLYQFPADSVILGGGYLVVDQSQFGFGLAREGDSVFLSSGREGELAGYRTSVVFENAEPSVSYGRVSSSSGDAEFLRLARTTRGRENAGPRVGPLVINEIMYHSPTGDEFIELVNITSDSVPLGGWRLSGVDFDFPNALVVPPNGFVVVVNDDPEAYRSRIGVPDSAAVVGPFGIGTTLAKGGESLTLFKPNSSGDIRADRVIYDDDSPWSALADGIGVSLSRIDITAYGNEASNWAASILGGTPGRANESLSNVAQDFPYFQDFESVNVTSLPGWNLSVNGLATWAVTAEGAEHGVGHLAATNSEIDFADQQATLVVNLADQVGRTDLALDFDLLLSDADHQAWLDVSGDGIHWSEVSVMEPIPGAYTEYAFDLDVVLDRNNIVLDDDVYIRFRHQSDLLGRTMFALDDVRLSDIDLFAPNIISQNPSDVASPAMDQFQVTFDDPIDGMTFTPEDVFISSPSGESITPTSITSEDMLTWTIEFEPQFLHGQYRVRIGPSILDTDGNLMSQGGTLIDGRTATHEPFIGSFNVGPSTAQAYPYVQDFSSLTLNALTGWYFATEGAAIWQMEGNRLKADQVSAVTSNQDAILVVDLSSQVDAMDLSLDFWVERRGGSSRQFWCV